ncbi:sensor histidine kinase [Caldalkalibacillus salinus]|uniref:sensor histidine kinase n=1 Tax=Caldalkalibacillus salinus TaxID=2803787 RepID=UPI0019205A7B|nr:HAMP domain-containing sensor histidine kinase [Caldalkalibacillus salinus]
MLMGILLLLLLPRLLSPIPELLDRWLTETLHQAEQNRQEVAVDQIISRVAANPLHWSDTEWQASVKNTLNGTDTGLMLLDETGQEMFRTGPPGAIRNPYREILVTENGKVTGTILLFTPDDHTAAILSASLSILLIVCIVLFIRRQMGRYVVKPLEAMSEATRKIAEGNMDFQLPRTTVVEVNEVGTALHELSEEIQKSIKRQSQLEHERRFYIGAIAHDLRTPLFALRGFLSRLEQGLARSPEKAERYLTICRQKAEHLERLVSDLSSYVKSDILEQTIQKQSVPFSMLMREIIDGYRPLAAAKDVEIVANDPDDPCRVKADEHMLERAIENLMDNALRYTPSGGRIEITWERKSDCVQFTLSDSGPGIPSKVLPHIFDPFYREDTSRNSESGGSSGLGLTIAKRIVKAHGGNLTAVNRPSGGTSFTGWMSFYRDEGPPEK